MFHVRIRTFSLGSIEGIFFLDDCCGTTFWLSATPSGRAVWIEICGELGSNPCKRDRTVCSPRIRCDYFWATCQDLITSAFCYNQCFSFIFHIDGCRHYQKLYYLLDERSRGGESNFMALKLAYYYAGRLTLAGGYISKLIIFDKKSIVGKTTVGLHIQQLYNE